MATLAHAPTGLKQPRSPRHAISARVQIADSVSGRTIVATTSDVSVGGCYVETPVPLDVKSTVRIQLLFNGSAIASYGDVTRSDDGKGMAVKFRGMSTDQKATIKRWLFALNRPDY